MYYSFINYERHQKSLEGEVMSVFQKLLLSRKFWLSLVAVLNTLLFTLLPEFPDVLWESIQEILLFLIGMIAAGDVAEKLVALKK